MSDIDALFNTARTARDNAHAPYSGFRVGAAIRADDGRVYAGCNVENAAYPIGTCAEAGAIAAMIAGGGTHIEAIAIIGSGTAPCFPCGACRQRIHEFASAATLIHAGAADSGAIETISLDSLLPRAFGGHTLRDRPA